MLDRSSKLDDSLMDAYRSIHEVHKGHAAGESDIEKQASQLASDIRYKAKGRIRDGMNAEDKKRIYLKLLSASPAPGIVKNKAKRKLLGESVLINEIMPAGDTAAERTASVKRVVRGGEKAVRSGVKVAKRVARGVSGIAKREGTLSQKVTGAAIDAVRGRVGDVGSKVKSAAKKVSNWSKSDTTPSGKYSNVGSGRKEKVSSSQSKSETTSSYKARSEKKKTQQASTPQPKTSQSSKSAKRRSDLNNVINSNASAGEKANAKAALGRMKEGFSNWKLDLLGEEGYDHWRDKHLERGGIGAVGSKSPSRPYTRSEKQPKGKTVLQKQAEKEHGKGVTALDIVKKNIEKEHGKGAIMKTEETSAADKIINSIRSQRVDEGKLVHGPFGPYITDQKMPKEQREVPLRKVPYEDINSAKKVVEDAKMGRQSDEKLASLQKQFSGMDQSTPSNQHMLKRVNREINKRKKQNSVEEEVGVSSSAAILKARQEAELKAKEEAAVKKAKKAKNEEVALENRMASHTAGMSDAQKDSASNRVSKGTAYRMGRRNDEAAFGGRKRSGKRGNPQQYRASADSPEWEGRFPYGKSNIRQGKGSIKDLKNEYSPAVEKVIESIKINKASPKSPNCIIMPKKDDITDKAGGNGKTSTKNVVSKKQKQFFNQEGKTYKSFVESVTKLIGAAATEAGKGAITVGAKTVGKETVKQGVKQTAANAITTTGKSLGKGQLAKTTSSAITKAAPKTTAITKVSPKAIEKVKPKVTALAKSGTKTSAIQTATQTAIDKVGNKKPPTTGEKGGALANRDKGGALDKPQKQGEPSKGIDIKLPKKPSKHEGHIGDIRNPQ